MDNVKIGDRVIVEFELEVEEMAKNGIVDGLIILKGYIKDRDGKKIQYAVAPVTSVKEIVK